MVGMQWPRVCGLVGVLMVAWAGRVAVAAPWQICDLQVRVLEHAAQTRTLWGQVLQVQAQGAAECASSGTHLEFRPATLDYQSELPRRQWPKPGQTVTVRHRYLDGMCKNTGPCRIQHYSPLRP
jgi:hypothetical protein